MLKVWCVLFFFFSQCFIGICALVTGSSGLGGQRLVEMLIERGAKVMMVVCGVFA